MKTFRVNLGWFRFAALLLLICSGCIPIRDKTPRIAGAVWAGAPQLPVARAKVELQNASGKVIATSLASSNGTFQLPQKGYWRIIPLIGDVRPIERRVVIEADGYTTYTAPVWERSTNLVVHLDRSG